MNRNLNPNEFGLLGEAQEAGFDWDPETQAGFQREFSHPGRQGIRGSSPRFSEFDSEWQHWAPDTIPDRGRAMASYLSGYGHRSERN